MKKLFQKMMKKLFQKKIKKEKQVTMIDFYKVAMTHGNVSPMDGALAVFHQKKKNITSQFGEDGIVEYIFSIIQPKTKTCLEFGAWDGKHYSNSWNLIENKGWKGIMIEMDKERCDAMPASYSEPTKNIYINEAVGYTKSDNLDTILNHHKIDEAIDMMVIDIDGDDWHVFNAIEKNLPEVLLIEYNPAIPNALEVVQKPGGDPYFGSSLLSIVNLGKQKGYEPVCVTDTNVILVKKEHYPLFNIADNAVDKLRPVNPYQSFVFQGYDGTTCCVGQNKRIWVLGTIADNISLLETDEKK